VESKVVDTARVQKVAYQHDRLQQKPGKSLLASAAAEKRRLDKLGIFPSLLPNEQK